MKEWFKEWFASELYLDAYRHRDETDAMKIIDLILLKTKIEPPARVLDAACGAGRHSKYLNSLGYKVVGFDLSRTLLRIAKENGAAISPEPIFFCSDLRNTHLKCKFDLIINLFTSFGYFENDEDNFRFLHSAYEMLLENGFYVLDYLNETYVRHNLVTASEKEGKGILVKERREILGKRVVKEITVISGEGEKKYCESVQLYPIEELEKWAVNTGYKIKEVLGDYSGSNFNKENSTRLILILQK